MGRKGANGLGSVYQDKHGVWWAQLSPDEYGKRPKASASTEQEAVKKLRALDRQREKGLNVHKSHQTVEDLLKYWLDEYVAPTAKARTTAGHRYTCKQYITPYLGRIRIEKLTVVHVQRWLNTLREQGLSEWTVKSAFMRLKTAFNMAVKARMLAENVANQIGAPTPERRDIHPLKPEEVYLLTKAAEGHRLSALIQIAIRLGLRRGELIGLRWSDIDLAKKEVRVTSQIQHVDGQTLRTSAKTRAGQRIVPLDADLVQCLQEHRRVQHEEQQLLGEEWKDHGLVFPSRLGTPLGARSLARQVSALMQSAGLPHRRIHDLRHTAATLMLAAGVQLVDVSKILGHSSPEITARIYAHSFATNRRRAIEAVTNLLQKECQQ